MNGRQNVTRLKGTSLHPDRQEIGSIDVYDIVVYYTRNHLCLSCGCYVIVNVQCRVQVYNS